MTYANLLSMAKMHLHEALTIGGYPDAVVPLVWTKSPRTLAHARAVTVETSQPDGKVIRTVTKHTVHINRLVWKLLTEEDQKAVVFHEAAHVIVSVEEGAMGQHGHGPKWVAVMERLGVKPWRDLSKGTKERVLGVLPLWKNSKSSKKVTTKIVSDGNGASC